MQEERRREEWEKTRSLYQSARAPYLSGRPSFCVASEKFSEESLCPPPKIITEKLSDQKNSRSSGNSRPLFDFQPWRRDVLEPEGEEDDAYEFGDHQPTIKEAYEHANGTITSHLDVLEKSKLIELLPVVLPQQEEKY